MLEACGGRIRSVVGLAACAVTLAVTAACSGSSSSPSGLHGASPSALALSPPGSPASAFPTGPPRTPAAGSSSATPHNTAAAGDGDSNGTSDVVRDLSDPEPHR